MDRLTRITDPDIILRLSMQAYDKCFGYWDAFVWMEGKMIDNYDLRIKAAMDAAQNRYKRLAARLDARRLRTLHRYIEERDHESLHLTV